MRTVLIKNGTSLAGEQVDILIEDDKILQSGDTATEADFEYDAEGRLVTPTFSEPHCHLDLSLTAGKHGWNEDGSLLSGIEVWNEAKSTISKEEVKQRAKKTVRWFVANGVTRIRSHVDTSEAELKCAEAILELKTELADTVEIQVVAFPQDGLLNGGGSIDRVETVLEMGADHVGGIPHFEYTDEYGTKSVKTALDLAEQYDVGVDLHIDEIDDPGSRFTEVLAGEVLRRDHAGEVTASHSAAMHSYPNAYSNKVINKLAAASINVITNPLSNVVFQGAYDDYPRRRGHTRIEELREAGVTVGIGHDSVMDVVYQYGRADPLEAAHMLAHYAHMHGREDVRALWKMLTEANASIMGLSAGEYGLDSGNEGSVIVHNAADPVEALRTRADRNLVISNGNIVSRTEPTESTVSIAGKESIVDFK